MNSKRHEISCVAQFVVVLLEPWSCGPEQPALTAKTGIITKARMHSHLRIVMLQLLLWTPDTPGAN